VGKRYIDRGYTMGYENENSIKNLEIQSIRAEEEIKYIHKKVDMIEKTLNSLKNDIYDGYIEKKVITTLKSETKLVDGIVSDTISRKVGKWVIGLIAANGLTLLALILQMIK
jgi:hypothetical protein